MRLIALLLLLTPLFSHASNAAYLKIYMMQDKQIALSKMDGIDDMDRYMKEVEANINKKLAPLPAHPSWGFLVMAVREDGQIKAWLDTDDTVPTEVATIMTSVAQATKGFKVKQGAVIFSLGFATDGADLPVNKMPFPTEWKQIANCSNEDCKEVDAEKIVLKSW